jgi:hypothetical protein
MSALSTLAILPYRTCLASPSLVHDEHMDGHEKRLALDTRRLKDAIRACSLNAVIPSAHSGPVATDIRDEEYQDKTFLAAVA